MAGHIASSGAVTWQTPESTLKPVREFFDGEIALDPCAGAIPIAKTNWRLPEMDGLTQTWGEHKTVYVNSPFGRYWWDAEGRCTPGAPPNAYYNKASIADWVYKCHYETKNSSLVVIQLLPAAVDTKHWQEIIFPHANAVCFIRGRLKFVGATASAPMACALVQWGSQEHHSTEWFEEVFSKTGKCFRL